MKPADTPLFSSPRLGRNLWQQYRIFSDRLELQGWVLLGTLTIPLTEIEEVWVSRPLVREVFRFSLWARGLAFKLDLADFYPHVGLRRRSGFMRHIHFTPEDPDRFVTICKELLPEIDAPQKSRRG